MAEMAGITRQTQQLFETGVRLPSYSYLAQLSHLGVDAAYLMTGERLLSERAHSEHLESIQERLTAQEERLQSALEAIREDQAHVAALSPITAYKLARSLLMCRKKEIVTNANPDAYL